MRKTAAIALTHRRIIAAVNALLLLLVFQGVWDIVLDLPLTDAVQHRMEEILEALGTIMVAFGVALEERETLLRFLGVYPAGHTTEQQRTDHHCHGYGLSLLLVGLFVEVSVFIVRMPDLDTVDFDPLLIVAGTALSALGGLLLARLTWLLCTVRSQLAAGAGDPSPH